MKKSDLVRWKEYLIKHDYLSDDYGLFCKLYNMTTENILEFVNKTPCENKNILTVVGSGDQALNTILNGARNITCFDINPISFCHLKLKKAAISTLSFEEFCRFFYIVENMYDDYTFFDRDLFDKFADKLDDDTLGVFNFLYNFYDYNTKHINECIYFYFNCELNSVKNLNNYLNPDKYEELAHVLNHEKIDIRFMKTDFRNLSSRIKDNKYDLILLSNISDYIHLMYTNDPLQEYHDDIMKLTNNLNMFGMMQVGYIYSNDFIEENCFGLKFEDMFSKKENREKVFTTDKFHTRLVTAYNNFLGTETDKIITYQKFK